ncbi:MAG: MlaA family lipoprotein [Thermodesulfobacteriota bacterium]
MKRGFRRFGFAFLFVFIAMPATHVLAEPAYSGDIYADPDASNAGTMENPFAAREPIGAQPGLLEKDAFYGDRNVPAADLQGKLFQGHHWGPIRVASLEKGKENDLVDDEFWGTADTITDPLESMNRAFFHFNDKLYFWFLKPVARGYGAVVPKTARIGVSNFFYNLAGPIRMVNCILQGKGEEAGYEFVRLFMNTTVGLGGLMDVATHGMDLDRYDEDLGQTLGVYGCGPSFYIHWPFLGPSSGRDTLGMFGDSFLNPLSYLAFKYNIGARTYDRINNTSFTIGNYEDFKRSAIDPYVAFRDAYYQNREDMIRK